MSKGRDATTITDSTGRRRLTKLWDGAAAARCGRLRAGPAATPRRPRDYVGATAFWSCALKLGPSRRRARRCRDAHPPRRCCFVLGIRPYRSGAGCRVISPRRLDGGRAVAPHERPARMMGGSASEQRPRERRPPPRHRRDVVLVTASAPWRAMSERTRESPPAPDHRPRPPAQWTSTAR